MNDQNPFLMDRRTVLRGLGIAGAAGMVGVSPLLADEVGNARTLIMVQLAGGNDGLSTIVPYADDAYIKARKTARIQQGEVLRIDPFRGFHPKLTGMRRLYDAGSLAIVEGVGYPEPNRSHFASFDIWHSASRRGRTGGEGWISRLCQQAWPETTTPELTVHVGKKVPYSLYSTTHPPLSFVTPAGYQWVGAEEADEDAYRESGEQTGSAGVLARLRGKLRDAQKSSIRIRRSAALYQPSLNYPADEFGNSLRCAASLVNAGIGSRVLSVELGGFDTHNNQRGRHDRLMQRLDRGLTALVDDLSVTERGREAVVLVFSEFGRRVAENGSRGTDHGVAGPLFVCGHAVKGGLYGKHPSLTKLDKGDLVHTTDFRSVYATIVDRWFGVEPTRVLEAEYPQLEFLG